MNSFEEQIQSAFESQGTEGTLINKCMCFWAAQAIEFLSQLAVNGFSEQERSLIFTLLALVFPGVGWKYH